MATNQESLETTEYSYLIYRTDAFSRNATVTTASNEKLFDIHFAELNSGDWIVSFLLGTMPPQIAMQVQKPAQMSDFDVTDYTRNHRTLIGRDNFQNYIFQDKDEKVQIGYLQWIGASVNTQCKMVITRQALHMLNLIISTGFCIQEWKPEELRLMQTQAQISAITNRAFIRPEMRAYILQNHQYKLQKRQADERRLRDQDQLVQQLQQSLQAQHH
ncbi:hypothetical protein HDV04_003433 [Boothiomyces sp. JEL0838]|nr:hypothetical protein HDV04_003433 [Boothiomyces sp. JEL0838]